jgi:nitroreductase
MKKRRPSPADSGKENEMDEIYTRVSVRQFEDRPVEKDKIDKILSAAMQSPSAGDEEAWRFYVVTDRDMLEKLSKASPYASPAAHAPAALVISWDRESLRFPEFGEIDCAIASENVLLAIEGLDLGGVMLGIAPIRERMDAVHTILRMSANEEAFTVIPFGYPKRKGKAGSRFDSKKVHYL